MEHTDESDRELLLRAEVIRSYMLRHPGLLDPFDALVGIVWPTPEFAARFLKPRHGRKTKGICSRCGCDFDDHTPGCPTCWERQYHRLKNQWGPNDGCSGCGCRFDVFSATCDVCKERKKSRLRARKRGVRERWTRNCIRCDIVIAVGDYTPGCSTCRDRKYRDGVKKRRAMEAA